MQLQQGCACCLLYDSPFVPVAYLGSILGQRCPPVATLQFDASPSRGVACLSIHALTEETQFSTFQYPSF